MGFTLLERPPAFVEPLKAWAKARQGQPYVWGQTNCVQICLEAADVIAGTRLAEKHRGKYASAPQALRYMLKHDLTLAAELAGAGFGQPDHFGDRLLPGDILLHWDAERRFEHGYVVFGPLCLTSRPVDGVCAVKTGDVINVKGCRAWRKL